MLFVVYVDFSREVGMVGYCVGVFMVYCDEILVIVCGRGGYGVWFYEMEDLILVVVMLMMCV